ncbi:MAG TPA: ABC transporter permease subunit [Candidatus Dormibacteraeota bacterium]|jgi:ABC-type Na+ efflux pump permease subunit
MSLSRRRVRAVLRKELREYRRSGAIVGAMVILPVVFIIPPLIQIFALPASASDALQGADVLLYMLGIPALVPAALAAYAVVGERQQGTLEPVLTTPLRREEFLLGKALASLIPSLAISYLVYAAVILAVEVLAARAVAEALLQVPEILAQLVFTPLVAGLSIWIGMAISTRSSDPRTAQQLGTVASLPTVAVAALIAYNVIHPTLGIAIGFGVFLVLLNAVSWRLVSSLLDRERLITGTK